VQTALQFSHAEAKDQLGRSVEEEMAESEDISSVEEGVLKFLEWLRSGKLEIRAFPSENIHAKLYIMTFVEEDRDVGRVITGSSNFTRAGLVDNLEFNVELKNPSDYKFARQKFEELWKDAVDVKEKYIETIQTKTWLNNNISPYELYLKFLYEYFKDEIGQTEELFYKYVPSGFKKLEYQEQAVLNAKKIVEEYGGVFISDVVGLGKTYISAILARQLEGRKLVIAPPALLDKNSPGSWPNVFLDFGVSADFESRGKLDKLIARGTDKFDNVFIDEAHSFRTETNVTYEKLAQICRGKRVILVTATPYNNSPRDVLSQIKLFQSVRKSNIPNLPDLEGFFLSLERKFKGLDRRKDYQKYIEIARSNAKEIREKVLKYLMVRRTRTEIECYFGKDLARQNLSFPEVADPEPIFYELNEEENRIFSKTMTLLTEGFGYARYTPMLFYEGDLTQPEKLAQRNMGKFMKLLLVKRLESSFYAFKKSVGRFIRSYELFLQELENGNVYVSKKHTNKIFELLENDDMGAVQKLIEEDKATRYTASDFGETFKPALENDLGTLREIASLWEGMKRDPKLLAFVKLLQSRKVLKENNLIIFTESKETATYLAKNLEKHFPEQVLCFTGSSSAATREKVIENFDARARFPKDGYRILITTGVLAEGVNLHRANVVLNYDIPWNPTRLMQRVGRINRVDTKFKKIYTFNFFPTEQANTQLKLEEAAKMKIQAFISMLGADAQLLTEGEPIESHELFDRLLSKKTITGEDEAEESELKYLQIIRNLRDSEPDLFERVKRLPKKARTAKVRNDKKPSLVTYFRKGKLQKFFLATKKDNDSRELDFITAAKLLETSPNTKRAKLGPEFYELLGENKEAFELATTEEMPEAKARGGRDSATQVLKILKAVMRDTRKLTDDQEAYLRRVMKELEEGGLPKQTAKTVRKALDQELIGLEVINPLKVIAVLQTTIPSNLLKEHRSESAAQTSGPREVILSEYLVPD